VTFQRPGVEGVVNGGAGSGNRVRPSGLLESAWRGRSGTVRVGPTLSPSMRTWMSLVTDAPPQQASFAARIVMIDGV
jgi:hypothetical protein